MKKNYFYIEISEEKLGLNGIHFEHQITITTRCANKQQSSTATPSNKLVLASAATREYVTAAAAPAFDGELGNYLCVCYYLQNVLNKLTPHSQPIMPCSHPAKATPHCRKCLHTTYIPLNKYTAGMLLLSMSMPSSELFPRRHCA